MSHKIFILFLLIAATSHAQQWGAIHGNVIDDTTVAAIVKANIILEGTRRGTASDENGRFVLKHIPPGPHVLRVRVVGYAEARYPVRLNAGDSVHVEIRLRRVLLKLGEINVTAARENFQEQSLQTMPSVTRISAGRIRRVTAVGEPDLFRALQMLPGVSAPSYVSNQLFIRGGSPDQNLVRLDGVPIYNPFHLFGLAANINPDIVDQVTVSTGGFSARYGDRLSGVVDVETRRPNEPFLALGNISLLSSKLMLAGRPDTRLQWLLSGRRSYHDWAAKLFGEKLPYHFYDLFGKATFIANPQNSLNLSLFYSADIFFNTENTTFDAYQMDDRNQIVVPVQRIGTIQQRGEFGFPWNNLAASLRWERTLSPHWSSTLMVGLSRTHNTGFEEHYYTGSPGVPQRDLDFYSRLNRFDEWSVSNALTDRLAAATLLWQPGDAWQVQAGAEWSQARFNYQWKHFDTEDSDIVLFFDGAPDSFFYRNLYNRRGFFVESLWRLASRLRLQPSLRLDYRAPLRQYTFDPRVSANFEIKADLNLQAALGRYHQGLSFLREGGLFGVNELYFPMNFNGAATHGIIGVEYQPRTDAEIKVEAYYKNFDRQAVPVRSARSVSTVGIAEGWAYGFEATARRGNWQAFYVFSHVRRQLNDVAYDTPWDVRHRLQASGQIYLGKSWDLDFQWDFHTGQPYSPFEVDQAIPRAEYNPRTGHLEYRFEPVELNYPIGAIRYPVYHRLDVTFSKRLAAGKWSLAPYLQILNVYNRKNPVAYEEDYVYRSDASDYVAVKKPIGVPILPAFGARFTF